MGCATVLGMTSPKGKRSGRPDGSSTRPGPVKDPGEALEAARLASARADLGMGRAVQAARVSGMTWVDISERSGLSRDKLRLRYGDLPWAEPLPQARRASGASD
jgi:hypothetical protein